MKTHGMTPQPMINALFSLILLLSLITSAAAQESLYMPAPFKKLYEKGETRSFTGAPGNRYWLNHAQYNIKARVYPQTRLLKGSEKIIYHNAGPDTLKEIVLRVYQDIYRRGNVRDFPVDKDALTDGMEILSLRINDVEVDTDDPQGSVKRNGTNLFLKLKQAVLPAQDITLHIEWKFHIADKSTIRSGMYDKTSGFVAYWYPQIAVYDDYFGWDRLNYTGQQEFYNDFHTYDVHLTLPAGYNVWATGLLQNAGEILSKDDLEKWQKAHKYDDVVSVAGGNPDAKAWHFRADHVPDFAFAFSDHFRWDLRSVDNGSRRVLVQAVYSREDTTATDVCEIAARTINYMSTEFPKIVYPYPSMTVFISKNGGGMEFPMMVNDGSVADYARRVGLTSHEITHTYFPFMMGINERRFAFMDEGMAVMLPFKVQNHLAPKRNIIADRVKTYNRVGGSIDDVPVMTPSNLLKGQAYRNASYNRPGLAYEFLRDLLGDELFIKAIGVYVKEWSGKHPLPYDFFFTMNRVTGQNLNWYFKAWFFDWAYADLAIEKAERKANNWEITVLNRGGLPLPVRLHYRSENGEEGKINKSAAVWRDNPKRYIVKINTDKDLKKIWLDTENVPDVQPMDNKMDKL